MKKNYQNQVYPATPAILVNSLQAQLCWRVVSLCGDNYKVVKAISDEEMELDPK